MKKIEFHALSLILMKEYFLRRIRSQIPGLHKENLLRYEPLIIDGYHRGFFHHGILYFIRADGSGKRITGFGVLF